MGTMGTGMGTEEANSSVNWSWGWELHSQQVEKSPAKLSFF